MSLMIGGHASIAGSVLNALKSFQEWNAGAGQIFVHSPRSWKFPPINQEISEEFKKNLNIPLITHASYLINIASNSQKLYYGSINVLKNEITTSSQLGIKHVCLHPGSNKNEKEGISQIIKAITKIRTTLEEHEFTLCFENTSGGGGKRAWNFKELESYFKELGEDNLGIVLDTQHCFAAGYDLRKFKEFKQEIESTIGFKRIKFIHLNDSKTELKSNHDKHEHIGKGNIGRQAFQEIVNDKDFLKIPMVCETPVEKNYGYKENIEYVRNLVKK